MKKLVIQKPKNPNRCLRCGCYINIKKKHECKPNPMLGKKVSEETKKKISDSEKGKKVIVTKKHRENLSKALKGKYVGENNLNWKGGKKQSSKLNYQRRRFEYEIRGLKEYKEWREEVLKRDILSYPNIPKNIQVHHIKPFRKILNDNNIKNVEEAKNCKELWNVENGQALRKGEHYIITMLERKKYVSKGFIRFLEVWIALNEEKAKELE